MVLLHNNSGERTMVDHRTGAFSFVGHDGPFTHAFKVKDVVVPKLIPLFTHCLAGLGRILDFPFADGSSYACVEYTTK